MALVGGRAAARRLRALAQQCRCSAVAAALPQPVPTGPAPAPHLPRRLRAADCRLETLLACVEPVLLEDYPLASEVVEDVVIYDRDVLAAASGDGALLPGSELVMALEDELMAAFSDGPGIVVIRNAIGHDAIDRVSASFGALLEQERAAGTAAGDHFGEPGANSRLWNSLEKLALADPPGFARYFANDVVPAVSRAWLGPAFQVTSQLNIVHPSGAAQTPHRDYHLGFMTAAQKERYPAHVHRSSAMLTLQGAVAHCDMPVECGPTTYLPHSHKMEGGYLAYELAPFKEYYREHRVQLPLSKGDAAFFNPALFHAAGDNLSADIDREANLLQISSSLGRAMETVDRQRMSLALYPTLRELSSAGELTEPMVANVVAASAEGYPFPTNLDVDQPIGGLAPRSQSDVVTQALEEGWPLRRLGKELADQQGRRCADIAIR